MMIEYLCHRHFFSTFLGVSAGLDEGTIQCAVFALFFFINIKVSSFFMFTGIKIICQYSFRD